MQDSHSGLGLAAGARVLVSDVPAGLPLNCRRTAQLPAVDRIVVL